MFLYIKSCTLVCLYKVKEPSSPSVIPLKAFLIPGRVCSVGHQSADQQFMAVLSSNVERSIAILIHTINFPTWWKEGVNQIPIRRREKHAQIYFNRSLRQHSHHYHFGWGFESVWSVREWLPCAGDSSLLCSVKHRIQNHISLCGNVVLISVQQINVWLVYETFSDLSKFPKTIKWLVFAFPFYN